MKLIFLIVSFIFMLNLKAQYYDVSKVFNTYFLANPFEDEFNIFFKKLNAEPALFNKVIHRRTDSTLFSFKGNYNHYEQAGFVFTTAEFILEEIPFKTNDSNEAKDTIIQYQVNCYCFGGETGLAIAKDALKNFNSDMATYHNTNEITKKGEVVGTAFNYFFGNLPVSPVTASWMKIDENKSAFTVIVRLKLKQNNLELYNPSTQ